MNLDDICGNCGKRHGEHSFKNDACPIAEAEPLCFHATNKFVAMRELKKPQPYKWGDDVPDSTGLPPSVMWVGESEAADKVIARQLAEIEASGRILHHSNVLTDAKPTNPKDACGVRKAPMSTVPANVLAELGTAMLEGALKYGRHNYREVGVRASVYYDGTMRHLMAWWEGEDIDTDSNLSHITKAIASLTVLRDAMMRDMVEDDRPPKTPNMYADLNKRAAELTDRYADRDVRHITVKDHK